MCIQTITNGKMSVFEPLWLYPPRVRKDKVSEDGWSINVASPWYIRVQAHFCARNSFETNTWFMVWNRALDSGNACQTNNRFCHTKNGSRSLTYWHTSSRVIKSLLIFRSISNLLHNLGLTTPSITLPLLDTLLKLLRYTLQFIVPIKGGLSRDLTRLLWELEEFGRAYEY